MHDASVTLPAIAARQGGADALVEALQASRRDTLATFAAYEQVLPGLLAPQRDGINPPLWELGHVGWFQEFWLARNLVRNQGSAADPDVPRTPAIRRNADALYNSSEVLHDTRWSLPLPDADRTRVELAQQLAGTLALLRDAGDAAADTLYFFRLTLLHEDTHHEAALYLAQALGIAVDDARWQATPLPAPPPPLALGPGRWLLGSVVGPGFAFDNELCMHAVELADVLIDAQVVRWAGRRLPTEAEWECAAVSRPEVFRWGDVWEWTASPFQPFAGFRPHPYRDYSAPWFDGRPVLRGASHLTQPRMRHPRYRNFFPPYRNDVPAGFRSCVQ